MGSSLTIDSKLRAVRSDVASAERDPRDSAGLLLGRLTALPALVFLPFMLTSFPLLLIGYFKPLPVILLWLVLTALVVPYVWRRIPSVTGAADWGTARAGLAKPTPRWTLWSLLAISLAFGIFQAVYHSQFIIPQLDAGSYMQFANWISAHGSTAIPENAQYFGGHPSSITFWSAAFYQVGNGGNLVPQFMAGLPMVLSLGFWAGGMRLALFWGPVLGALAVFTFGGLVARLVGPRWAPFAALAIAITIPMAYVSRNTYSEPLALIFLVGGLSLWIDAQRSDRGQEDAARWRGNWRHHSRSASHVLAGVAGLLLGLIFLVRVDGPADIMFIVPYCGLLILRRQRQVVALLVGLIVGTVYGAVDGVFLTLPYLENNKQSVEGMVAAIVLLLIVTIVAVPWLRRRGSDLSNPPKPRLVQAVTALPFIVVAVFIIRPYVERNWHYLQYAPLSLHWIYWYTGFTTIAFAVIAYAMLGRRAVKGEAPVWVLPLLVFACATVVFLVRPGITYHQPYASRRLVPAVLPGLILLAVWLTSWISQRARVIHLVNVPDYLKRTPRAFVTAVCAAAIFLPPMIGNFGLSLSGSDGLALTRTYVGEIAAVDKICAAIPKDRPVLIIDWSMWWQFGQTIRGMCNAPVAGVQSTPPTVFPTDDASVAESATAVTAVRAILKSGHVPFVIAPNQAEFTPLIAAFGGAGSVKFIMAQDTSIDEHTIFGTPHNPVPQRFTAYSWEPAK
jgi:hypothetical protein